MPKINSYPDVTDDWVGVLDASEKSPDLQPLIETDRQSLRQVLAEVQGLRGRQAELNALRKDTTQQLRVAVERGKELAIRIRSMVRGRIGPKSELLTLWKVAPLRKRTRKVRTDGEAPGTAPGAVASPPTQPCRLSP
ncbi:MAG TPA: hypothetical protein VHC97_25055 [Thermoanaerobaculia bacterium]|jgi:hypothetical protein|nr:hypothetical protein [Thermoanaerobaculia bacterium]